MKLILSTIHDGLTMRWEFEIITGDDDDLSHHVQSNIADESCREIMRGVEPSAKQSSWKIFRLDWMTVGLFGIGWFFSWLSFEHIFAKLQSLSFHVKMIIIEAQEAVWHRSAFGCGGCGCGDGRSVEISSNVKVLFNL